MRPPTILAIASYQKGYAFLHQAKAEGARVLLLTSLSLKDQWPRDAVDEIFYMPDDNKVWNREDTFKAVAFLARTECLDRIVPLDDFDLELAASLREHLRIPGMGETTVRRFRDKLAMRMCANEAAIAVPEFVHILNHARIQRFVERTPAPWVLKPRSFAGSIGIRKVETAEELWSLIHELGDNAPNYLLERYVPGDIFHVDSIVNDREILFAVASGYGRPPLDVAQGGGIFTTRLLERGSEQEKELIELNQHLLKSLGLVRGVSHTEYIIGKLDGKVYFLETAARVGGAHIAELVETATGINLWAEWARIEVAGGKREYKVPTPRHDYAGLLVSLAKQEHPDTSAYQYPEIVWRMDKQHHVGFIVKDESHTRVQHLLDELRDRVQEDFWAYAPAKSTPTE
ncbi:ATP-grasp domain-containing protein [uncultured Paludibaculum sp.]|uniref:ATP-grasp domain-containing protein n=1 Tax=uncultured Paludibaculum sp. TaxID=1765020 RepID=UPI002AAB3E42|nr:ATP-grasp domain-containing protein [uncultured Paludibaculum sp.]